MATVILDPLTAETPAEVPLANAPLLRVIAQVRFPIITAIEQSQFIAGFQESLRERYPVLRPETAKSMMFRPDGAVTLPDRTIWRFTELDGAGRVTLASEFMALETSQYRSRADFVERLREALVALDEHFKPKLVDRLGVRYIDRVTGDAANDIAKLIRPEVSGLSGTPIASHVQHAISEVSLKVDKETDMLARWGQLPPNSTVDPSAIESIPERSWILDVDMFSSKPMRFNQDVVVDRAKSFAERIYTFFRWFVNDEFLRRYGGEA